MSTPYLGIAHVSPSQNNKEVTLNTGLDQFDGAMNGELGVSMADANYTMNSTQTDFNAVFVFTGTLTAQRNVIVPSTERLFFVCNKTTGGENIQVKTSAGTGIVIAPSSTTYVALYCDGTNVVEIGGTGGGAIGGVSIKSASYTLQSSDNGKLVTLSTGSHTFTVPASPPSTTWMVFIQNYGTGNLTVANNSLDIDGVAASILVPPGNGLVLFTDGTNYFTERASVSATGGGGIGGVQTKSASYTILGTDENSLIALTTGSHTFTLPAVPPSALWAVFIENYGSGTLTVSPNSLNIDGSSSSLTFTQNTGVIIFTDGTNYFTCRGAGGGGGSSTLSGLSDVTLSSPTNGQVLTYNSGASKWENQAAGGGVSEILWTWPKINAAPANMNPVNSGNMNFTANQVKFMFVHIDTDLEVGNFTYWVTTNDSHNYDWGMFDMSGTLIWNLGATVFGATGQITTPFAQGSITIPAGDYWLAFTGNGTGLTFNGATPGALVDFFFYGNGVSSTPVWWTSGTSSSGGTLTGLSPAVPSAPTTSANLSSPIVVGTSAATFPVIALSS